MIEKPYRKERREQQDRALKKFPQDIQDAFATPEDKRTPGQKLLVAQVITVEGVDPTTSCGRQLPPKQGRRKGEPGNRAGAENYGRGPLK